MWNLEKLNLQKQRMDWWLPEARGGEWGKWVKVVQIQMYKQANKNKPNSWKEGREKKEAFTPSSFSSWAHSIFHLTLQLGATK